jgi:hypothetical protein
VWLLRFLQEPHDVTTQKTPFFIVIAVKTLNLTLYSSMGRLLIVTYGDLKRCGSRGPSYCVPFWFLQEPHGVTTQKTPFFIVTAVKTFKSYM